jgi:chromosome segregation ATPase
MEDDMNILSWLTRTEKTSQERAESIFQKMLKGGESAVSESDAQFAVSVIGRDEIQRRHEADVERRRREQRRQEIPKELHDLEARCIELHRKIPEVAAEIEKTHKKIEALERSLGESRDLLHRTTVEVETLRREGQSLGVTFPENPALPARPAQAPIPPSIPMAPKPAPDARSKWIPESPRQPAWPTVTGA